MNSSAQIPALTLWDLATIVLEEVENTCGDERTAMILARDVLVRIIQRRVRNMEIELCDSHVDAGNGPPRHGSARTVLDR